MSGHEGDISMYTLTEEQQHALVGIVIDGSGHDLTFDGFADAMLTLFDDIPGFETIPSTKATILIHHLWRTYHG
jgi:hypothetical protein